jgi:hypothetical protein
MKLNVVRRPRTVVWIVGIALFSAWTATAAAQGIKQPLDPKKLQICSDIAARLSLTKADDGTVNLTGIISNLGPGAYNNPQGALDAYFMVYTCHPPKTYAQESNLQFYAHTDLGTSLKANERKEIKYTYKIENFSRWGTFPNSATERQALKQFCVQVQKKGTVGFSTCEDSNNQNTTACTEVPYMEKIK